MSIKSELKSGVFYTFIFRYAGIATQIITTAILARILTPEEFGVIVAVLVFLSFFSLLSDSGIAVAIIQRKDLTDQEIFSLFVITILTGIILAGLFALSGPLIGEFYNNQEYSRIAILLSISLFFYSIHIVPSAIMFRDKRFKAIGILNLAVQLLSAILAIVLALHGFSYYSLIYQNIFLIIAKFILVLWLSPIKIYRNISFRVIHKIFNYSVFKFLYDIVMYFSRNSDNLLIGKYLGVIPLGYYDKAYKLMAMPVDNLANIISPVLHPVLSNHQNNPEIIYNFYKKLTKYLAILGLPLSIYLYFSAEEIIVILFGQQWLKSIPVFKYLSLAVWIQMVLSGSGSIFLSLGKTKFLFLSGFLSASTLVTAIFLGIFVDKSITAVALFILVAFIINLFQVNYFLIAKVFNKKLLGLFISFKESLFIGVCVFLANLILSLTINIDNIAITFIIKLLTSFLIFISILIITKEYKSLIEMIRPSNK